MVPPSKRRLSRLLQQRRIPLIAGVDEVGRGPLAGPVVAAAAVLLVRRFRARIDDSKRLSRRQREEACAELMARALWGLGIVSAAAIDAADIGTCSRRAMELAVADLPVEPEAVMVDGRERLALAMPQTALVRGDQRHQAIAAASIIAKVFRDRLMEAYGALYPGYEFQRHVGYGTARHLACLARLGPSPIHRRTFAPVARVAGERSEWSEWLADAGDAAGASGRNRGGALLEAAGVSGAGG